jgi:hypothetical protein
MTPLFKKLNLANATCVHVLNAPKSFEPELQALEGVQVKRQARGKVVFALAFVKTSNEVEVASHMLASAAQGDASLWMIYPKVSSKKYKCEFNRDSAWQALGDAGYEPVRQVAIDEDWSALRFRKTEFIKSMRRNPDGAISSAGRAKARAQSEG